MEFHSWKGLIVVLLIHHCKPQDTTTLLSTSEITQETETSPLDPELSPVEVAPEVAPPSLKDVEDAVQEASELSEERGPVEVLKELLVRVVEASLGETSKGGGGEEAGEAAVEEVEAEAGLEVEVVKEEAAVTGGEVVAVEAAGLGEEVKEEEVDATKADVEEGLVEEAEVTEETAQGEGAPGVGEEAAVEEGGAGEGEEIIEETAVEPKVFVEAGTILEKGEEGTEVETAGEMEVAVQEVGQEAEGATAALEQVDQETVAYLAPGVEEQPGGEGGEGPAEEAEAEGGAEEGGEEVTEPPLDSYEEMETTQSVVGEPVDEEEEGGEEVEAAVGAGEGGEEEVTEEGGDGEGEAVAVGEEGEAAVAAEGGVENGESVGEAVEQEVPAGAAGQPLAEAGEEIEVSVETPVTSDTEQPEVVPDLGEPSTEEEPGDLSITLTSSLSGEETNAVAGDDVLPGEESNHDNEIFTSKDNLNLELVKAAPTLDNSVEEIPATPPQPEEEEELGEPNEIEETTNVSEGTLGLEAWKIGAISAAVFLVLETLVIIVYVLKCRNRTTSAPAPERACEEACVEPEPATGVCEDDTLLAGNGDAQQIAALDPSDLSQVVTQQQDVEEEEEEEEEEAAMTEGLQLDSIEPVEPSQPNSEQELRTSVL